MRRDEPWFAPQLTNLRGPDQLPLRNIFLSLTEYLRRYFSSNIGHWLEVQGTTNADGELTFAHGAPFTPSLIIATEQHVSASTHDEGAFHVDSHDDTNVTIHFLVSTSGNDRANTDVHIHVLCLP